MKEYVRSRNGTLDFINLAERKDETPMTFCSYDRDFLAGIDEADTDLMELILEGVQQGNSGAISAARDRAPAKLLNTELKLAIGFTVDGKFHVMSYDMIIPLQQMGRTTGECYYDAFIVNLGILNFTELAKGFSIATCTGCSDGASSIDRSFRAITKTIPWLTISRMWCRMHVEHVVIKETFIFTMSIQWC